MVLLEFCIFDIPLMAFCFSVRIIHAHLHYCYIISIIKLVAINGFKGVLAALDFQGVDLTWKRNLALAWVFQRETAFFR